MGKEKDKDKDKNGGGNDDAYKQQEKEAERQRKEEEDRQKKEKEKQKKEETDRKATEAKVKADTAQKELKSDSSKNKNEPSVQSGMDEVGDTLKKKEVKQLKQDGYSYDQAEKIAGNTETVNKGAEKKLDKWYWKEQKAKEKAEAAQHSGSSSGNDAINSLLGTPPATPAVSAGPAISAGGHYGTADRDSWLAAELNAIDTFRPDTTPELFNNYQPWSLSDQLDSAASEADQFLTPQTTYAWDEDEEKEKSYSSSY